MIVEPVDIFVNILEVAVNAIYFKKEVSELVYIFSRNLLFSTTGRLIYNKIKP